MQTRIANTSVGASTARGMGPKGTVSAAREFLANINLARFSVESEQHFLTELNRVTRLLRRYLREGAQYWGSARKFLNIFLRGVVYNRHLCRRYKLSQVEPWLEVPLDSHVASGLKQEPNSQEIPRWKSVIGLDHVQNRAYQRFAADVAKAYGMCRIHLDLYYWRRPK